MGACVYLNELYDYFFNFPACFYILHFPWDIQYCIIMHKENCYFLKKKMRKEPFIFNERFLGK